MRKESMKKITPKKVVEELAAIGFANMWLAVFADVGVAVLAILNAMRAMHISEFQRLQD